MIAVATVLFAFPLGFFLRSRLIAALAYMAIFAHVFTFQTPYVLGSDISGRPDWSYLLITALIYAGGFGLVTLGHFVGRRRRARGTYQVTDAGLNPADR
jgi:hypothetical protein